MHLLQYMFWGAHPWYESQAWPNVAALLPCGVITAVWAWFNQRTNKRRLQLLEEVHYLAHTGKVHPRAKARLDETTQ